uniref:G-protein coupled receptors family 1 profile domain-containing protein n=2 Tax=Octopus bimaculoides TaxID=37653 RepID=A0A0L8HHY7_OCTBM
MSSIDMCFVSVSSFSGRWVFGVVGCKAYGFIVSVVSILSICCLTLIAIDRYVVIVKGWVNYRSSRKKSAFVSILIAWIYTLAWCICPLFGWGDYILEGIGSSCTFDYITRTPQNRSYMLCLNIFVFFLPIVIILICYINIIIAMYKHKKDMQNIAAGSRKRQGNKMSVELKTVRSLAAAIILFCAGWMPYSVLSLIAQFGNTDIITRASTGYPGIAAKCITCANPFFYALSNPIFLKRLKIFIFCGDEKASRRVSSFQTSKSWIDKDTQMKNCQAFSSVSGDASGEVETPQTEEEAKKQLQQNTDSLNNTKQETIEFTAMGEAKDENPDKESETV